MQRQLIYGSRRHPGREAEEKKVLNYFLMYSVALSERVRACDAQEMDAGREAAGRCGLAVLLTLPPRPQTPRSRLFTSLCPAFALRH